MDQAAAEWKLQEAVGFTYYPVGSNENWRDSAVSRLWNHAVSLQSQLSASEERVRWIPVEDRMPEADVWVLATDGDHWEVCNFHNGRAAKFWTAMHIHPITHWMPLPSPPQVIRG